MDYFVLLVGIHHLFTLVSSLVSLYFSSSIILGKSLFQKSTKLSPVITLYFLYIFIWSIWSSLNCGYLLILWRPDTVIYDSKAVFFLGFLPFMSLNLYSLMEFWLCVDRCFSVYFPLKYSTRQKKFLCFIILLCIICVMAITVWANNLIMAMQKDGITTCRFFTCLMKSRSEQYIIKVSITCCNFVCGCILAILIRFVMKNTTNIKGKNLNKTVLIIIFSTTFFDLVPNFMGQIFEALTTKPLSVYVGPYVTSLSAFNTALCTIIYSKAFKKAFRGAANPSHQQQQTPVIAYHSKTLQ